LMPFSRRAEPLRLLAERLQQPDLRKITMQPGISEAVRVSVYHHMGRSPDMVATLRRPRAQDCLLSVIYDKPDKPIQYDFLVPVDRYHKLLHTLRANKFDTLDDQPDLPFGGVDLWWIERAVGTFYHDVILTPEAVRGHHREMALAIRSLLPEAVRDLAF